MSEAPKQSEIGAKCLCGGAWIVFPLYKRCQDCGFVMGDPFGWQRLRLLGYELGKDNHEAIRRDESGSG